MAPSPLLIDTAADFNPKSKPATMAKSGRNLLLAPPSIAAREDALRQLFTEYDRHATDLQMLDRLSAGLVSLPAATYDLVLVLTDTDGSRRSEALQLLSRDVFTALVPAMRIGARLGLQDGEWNADDAKEAILAGLVNKNGVFEKQEEGETVIPLRLAKKQTESRPVDVNSVSKFDFAALNESSDDEELIDENDLLSEEDLKRRPLPPTNCQPQKRRPCKDCTCGLAAKLEAEDKERRSKANDGLNALKLDSNDLNELDFTVEGKTGSCNNCSLGDAFRCSTCPYIGLSAFKPGEEVRILNDLVQL